MNSLSTRPPLALYVAWHPAFTGGAELAEILRAHFRRDLFGSVTGGAGISLLFRWEAPQGENVPIPVEADGAEATAVILLADDAMAADESWRAYVATIAGQAAAAGLAFRLIPVAMTREGLGLTTEQAVRVDSWSETGQDMYARLISELTLEICRMLRYYLAHLERPSDPITELDQYLEPVRIFISHSKHAGKGETIARALRDYLHQGRGIDSFFDVYDIPAGLNFDAVLEHRVRQSAVVAIHTDSYSSREWCRREIIEAKLHNVPLIVANCLGDRDERGFPYMANVPIVRMNPDRMDRFAVLVGRILDEVLKDYLWKCRLKVSGIADSKIRPVPRPPELISLAGLSGAEATGGQTILYPDPPLSREEQRLFASVSPNVILRTMNEWLAENA
ncbi:toll/interleukin-1 receptor domain-containing protein [Sphingopyxis sp. NFH-91]|uniref:toll/interleukin-1 receptor domain-containing protein n=1 Tax=Sphingopyxis sp. NFH-91 TaxID=2744457 RepID=UPI001F1C3D79|nr:toll/interleukin-1 receptor domain-containing protein [Sphingopyxis sp. NFH-91]